MPGTEWKLLKHLLNELKSLQYGTNGSRDHSSLGEASREHFLREGSRRGKGTGELTSGVKRASLVLPSAWACSPEKEQAPFPGPGLALEAPEVSQDPSVG